MLVPLTLTFVYISMHEGDASRPYVPELRKLAAETPVYPGAQKIADKVILKDGEASLDTTYKSDSSFAEIESFYRRELPLRGWTIPPGPSGRFFDSDVHSHHYRRGDYFIAVEQDGDSDRFGITFIWEAQ